MHHCQRILDGLFGSSMLLLVVWKAMGHDECAVIQSLSLWFVMYKGQL